MNKLLAIVAACWSASAALAQDAPRPSPVCYPDLVYPVRAETRAIPSGVSVRYTHGTVWTCRTPTGFANQRWLWSWPRIEDRLIAATRGVFDEAQAREDCAANCAVLTAEEGTWLDTWSLPYLASATVRPVTSGTTRPVYERNADGTRNTVPVAGQRVQTGTRCDISKRLGQTSYYSVAGQPNVATADDTDVLGEVYALCTLRTPLGVNE